ESARLARRSGSVNDELPPLRMRFQTLGANISGLHDFAHENPSAAAQEAVAEHVDLAIGLPVDRVPPLRVEGTGAHGDALVSGTVRPRDVLVRRVAVHALIDVGDPVRPSPAPSDLIVVGELRRFFDVVTL